jgi:hypothetical protein
MGGGEGLWREPAVGASGGDWERTCHAYAPDDGGAGSLGAGAARYSLGHEWPAAALSSKRASEAVTVPGQWPMSQC